MGSQSTRSGGGWERIGIAGGKHWSAHNFSTQFNMADQSGRVHPNNEFRERLMEKVHVNVTETGKLAQQLLKSSRSHEVNSSKNFPMST